MNFENIRAELQGFIKDDEAGIFVLKGKWGVGKTWLIDDEMKVRRERINYAYVSLFSIGSLDELRENILAQFYANRATGKSDKGGRLAAAISEITNDTGSLGIVSRLITKTLISLDFEAVITIDDLERRSDGLSIKDVLGYCSQLRDINRWKVILVLNEDELSDDDKSVLEAFREKVINFEVELAPTPQEVVDLGFKQDIPGVVSTLEKLNVNNIRAVQRIDKFISKLVPKIAALAAGVRERVLNSATVLGWSYFSRTQGNIPWKFVIDYSSGSYSFKLGTQLAFGKEHKETDEEKVQRQKEDKYASLLRACNYYDTGPLEIILIELLEKGLLNSEKFNEAVSELSSTIKASQARSEYSQAWELYRNTFRDNTGDFANAIVRCFEEHSSVYEPRMLQEAVNILKELGHNEKATSIQSTFFEHHETFPMSYTEGSLHVRDLSPQIREEVVKRANAPLFEQQPLEVLRGIAHGSTNNPLAIEVLNGLDEDAWHDLFLNQLDGEPDLYFLVREINKFKGYSSETYQKVYASAKSALEKIADANPKARTMIDAWLE